MQPEKYSAIIIEPRQHDAFKMVLENVLSHLDERGDIIIFHGNANKDFLINLIDEHLSAFKARIKMVHVKVDNLSSRLLRCKKLYEHIPTEMFLVFQLSDVYYNKIYDFMKYDYVGAP